MMLKRLIQLTLILIAILFAMDVQAGVIFRPVHHFGLVGYWSFQEGAGTKAYDRSGQGNHGTLTGGPTRAIGKLGQALRFNYGINQYVNIVDNYNLDLGTGSKTLSAWIKTSKTGVTQTLIRKDNMAGSSGYIFRIESSNTLRILFADADSGASSYSAAGAVTDGNWHHVVAVYNRTADLQYLYVDSLLVDSDDPNISGDVNNTSGLRIGDWWIETWPIDGIIDEVRIYNRALTAQEIQRLYNMGR